MATGVWGINAIKEVGLARALPTQPYQAFRWNVLLLHRSGVAGPLYEQSQYRDFAGLNPLEYPATYSLPYDNGGAFILER
jgi:hypothetical protein